MKKILIVTFNMLPHSTAWGSCQRIYYLAQALQKQGAGVKVIAVNDAKYNTFGRELLTDVIFPNIHTPVDYVGKNASKIDNVRKDSLVRKVLKKIAFIYDRVRYNEIQDGAGIKSHAKYKKALPVIREVLENNKFDVVLVSAPPFVMYRSLQEIRKYQPDTKIVMDYRDPWNSWHDKNPYTSIVEGRYIKMADLIVCTNESLCENLSEKYSVNRSKFQVVANGYSEEKFVEEDIEFSTTAETNFNILYAGAIGFSSSVDEYRDCSKIVNAIRRLHEEGLTNIKFTFVGVKEADMEIVNGIKQDVGDMFNIVGFVSNNIAKNYIKKADVCLLVHTASDNSGKYLISGKAYDYIQMKKFMLSVSKSDSQHARLLAELNIGINSENDTDAIVKAVKDCYTMWKNDCLEQGYKTLDIESYSRSGQVAKYMRIINGL